MLSNMPKPAAKSRGQMLERVAKRGYNAANRDRQHRLKALLPTPRIAFMTEYSAAW